MFFCKEKRYHDGVLKWFSKISVETCSVINSPLMQILFFEAFASYFRTVPEIADFNIVMGDRTKGK